MVRLTEPFSFKTAPGGEKPMYYAFQVGMFVNEYKIFGHSLTPEQRKHQPHIRTLNEFSIFCKVGYSQLVKEKMF